MRRLLWGAALLALLASVFLVASYPPYRTALFYESKQIAATDGPFRRVSVSVLERRSSLFPGARFLVANSPCVPCLTDLDHPECHDGSVFKFEGHEITCACSCAAVGHTLRQPFLAMHERSRIRETPWGEGPHLIFIELTHPRRFPLRDYSKGFSGDARKSAKIYPPRGSWSWSTLTFFYFTDDPETEVLEHYERARKQEIVVRNWKLAR